MSDQESLILYIVMFLVSALLLSLCQKCKQHKHIRKTLYIASTLFPILVLGMRFYVGTDYENYLSIYNKYKEIPLNNIFSANIECLNIILCKTIYNIYDNQYIFIMMYAILTITIAFKAILNIDSKNTFLVTFMYLCLFFPWAANVTRQSLAIAVILYAYTILFKNPKRFCLLCIIASLIHSSAIIILPIGIICYIVKDIKKCNFIIIGLYSIITLIILIGLPFASSNVFIQKLLGYLESSSGNVEFGLGVLILNLPILLLSIFFYSKIRKEEPNYSLYIFLFVINILLSYLGYVSIFLNRFSLYFSIIQIFLIPKGLELFKSNGIRRILEIIFAIIMLYQFWNNYYVKNNCDIFPYNYIEISALLVER